MKTLRLKPVYRQLSGLLVSCFFSFTIALSCLAFLWLQQVNISESANEKIPQLERNNNIQSHIVTGQYLISQTLLAKDASQYFNYYQQLVESLNALLTQVKFADRNASLPLFSLSQSKLIQSVERLSENASRNQQLKQSAIIQLDLLAESLRELIVVKEQRQQALFDLVSEDSLNDTITVNRAKAYAELTQELDQLNQLALNIYTLQTGFNELSIQISLSDFEYYRDAGQALLEFHLLLLNSDEATNTSALFQHQLNVLITLLFEPETMLAKWRSHLRVGQEYRTLLSQQQAALAELSLSYTVLEAKTNKLLPQWLNQSFTQFSIYFNQQEQKQLILAVFAGASLLFILLLIAIRRRIKRFSQKHYDLQQQLIEGKADTVLNTTSSEHQQLASLAEQITQPEHGELAYQALQQQMTQTEQVLAQQQQAFYWSFNRQGQLQVSQALAHVFDLNKLTMRWRSCFSKEQQQELLAAAKSAKQTGQVSDVLLLIDKTYYKINLLYKDNWSGSLANVQETVALVERLNDLKQQIAEQEQSFKVQNNKAEQEINQSLTPILINHQLSSLSLSKATTGYQLLAELCFTQQLKQFSYDLGQQSLTFQDYDFYLLLSELAVELANQAMEHKTKISLNCSEHLAQQVTIARDLFSYFITALTRLCLQSEQAPCSFAINLDVADKDKEQYTVNYQFSVQYAKELNSLPALIEHLVNEQHQTSHQPSTIMAIKSLFQSIHGQNLQAKLTEQGYLLSFQLPHVLRQKTTADSQSALNYQLESLLTSNIEVFEQLTSNYRTTQVQALFAYADFEQALPWLRLLNSLGLKVHFVGSEQAMLLEWSTGQYLLLFSEFTASPLMSFAYQQEIARAIFTWQEQAWPVADEVQQATKTWQFHSLESILTEASAKKLAEQLTPWLLAVEKPASESVKIVYKTVTERDPNLEIPSAFSLQSYADNQGSAELAALMMPEYIEQLHQLSEQLAVELRHKDTVASLEQLKQLTAIAKVLAATELLSLLTEFARVLMRDDIQQALQMLPQLITSIEAVELYADAI